MPSPSTNATIRPAYSSWPLYNRRLREVVAGLTEAQLALSPGPGRWPIWASIGHVACQRVFWLCDFAGEPGVETTPFPDAASNCPGDDDLETVWSAGQLVAAIDSTFAIVEACLDRWSLAMLDEVIRRPDFGDDWVHSRGAVIQRCFAHDISHISELNDVLSRAGLDQVDLWS
jgi:DinB superfamily